jgi:Delta7-sterol 5-desaturase
MMEWMASGITAFRTMPYEGVVAWALLLNIGIFIASLVLGELLVRVFKRKAVAPPAPPITRKELLLAASTVLINALVLVIGAVLWRAGLITVRYDLHPLAVLLDALVLFLAMDLAMYVSHRLAHLRWFYLLLHATHHDYEYPRPLTLFVLNPFEAAGFGVLWVILLMIYPSTWLGIVIYLTLNVLFGLVGHLGVEPFPKAWVRLPLIRLISTSTFHAEHHGDRHHNFGFYTLIWDRLFGTISPDYLRDFERAQGSSTHG